MSSKWQVLYTKWTGFSRRIQIWNQFLHRCFAAPAMGRGWAGVLEQVDLILSKWHICSIIRIAIWRRIQICNGNFLISFYSHIHKRKHEIKNRYLYQIERIFKENPDLNTFCVYLLCIIQYTHNTLRFFCIYVYGTNQPIWIYLAVQTSLAMTWLSC